jgi:hypothetical protein
VKTLSPLAWTPPSSTEAPIKVLFVEDDERLARLTTR